MEAAQGSLNQSKSPRLRTMAQADRYTSPWPLAIRLRMLLWQLVWLFLFRPTPKPFSRWRVFLLRLFGTSVQGRPFVAASAVIKMPWNLILEDRSCLAPQCEVYNLASVTLRQRAVVAQQAYLCGGTHDFEKEETPLVVGPIEIGVDAFVGARAFVLPGVRIESGAVIGACSVVTRDMPSWMYCAGNPCRPLRPRKQAEEKSDEPEA